MAGVLDAFGHRGQAEGAAEVDEGPDECVVTPYGPGVLSASWSLLVTKFCGTRRTGAVSADSEDYALHRRARQGRGNTLRTPLTTLRA